MSIIRARQGNETDLERFRQQADLWEHRIHALVALCDTDEGKTHSVHGPLAGVTVGVKDIIDVVGVATRNGSDACKDAPPATKDASVVASLRAAGARIVAKTTTTEFAFTDPTACRNPFDLNRTPGGSSSGSGAAVAAGLVDIGLGTQTAGSLCRPAAYCGVVGFKPSYALLSTIGVTPLSPSFDSVGIIAGTVELARSAFAAMTTSTVQTHDMSSVTAICGLWNTSVVPYADTLAAFNDAATVLATLGLGTEQTTLQADVEQIVTAHRTVMTYEAAMAHGAILSDARADLLKPKFAAGLRSGTAISSDAAARAAEYLAEAKRAFWAGLAGVDVVLTLPVPDGPPLIDGTTGYQDWLTPWTVFGGPLICLPWGLDRLKRPRSVMLAARPGQDAQLLSIAAKLEALGPSRPLPQLPRR
ncbi:amidase [Tateyamaria pelophila]|uniref:amidase n=1 Tax=Tateyamaria pelophila TaxID=328415 RepID=UPI001CBC47F1|nr:amidase [Tateyamaria pelophila]